MEKWKQPNSQTGPCGTPQVEISYSPLAPLLLLILYSTRAIKEDPAGWSPLPRPLSLPLSQSWSSQLTLRASFFHPDLWGQPPKRNGSLKVQLIRRPGVTSAWLAAPPPPAGSLCVGGAGQNKPSTGNDLLQTSRKTPSRLCRSQSGTFRNIVPIFLMFGH